VVVLGVVVVVLLVVALPSNLGAFAIRTAALSADAWSLYVLQSTHITVISILINSKFPCGYD
jgi:hypothetical protein